jgi:hypothetical protein
MPESPTKKIGIIEERSEVFDMSDDNLSKESTPE